MYGLRRRVLGLGVGRADRLAHLQAAAGVDDRSSRRASGRGRRRGLIRGVRPNSPIAITSTSSCRPRSCRSFTRAVSAWSYFGSRLFLSCVEVVAVRVPAAAGLHGHERHARLDQPPGEQAALAQVVAAVPLAQLAGLPCDVERLRGPCRWSPSPGRRGRTCRARRCRPCVSMSRRIWSSSAEQLAAAVEPVGARRGRAASGCAPGSRRCSGRCRARTGCTTRRGTRPCRGRACRGRLT